MGWLSITAELEAAQAEALSEALIEAGADSVDLEPLGRSTRLSALAAPDADPRALLAGAARTAGIASPEFSARPIDDEDWVRRSQSQFGPLQAGRRLWIVPTWRTPPDDPQAIVVRLDPGLAFGTGSHPSTRLILNFLAEQVLRNKQVLDFGCGSGILAIAAARLGALEVRAIDVDAQALEVARENARLNGVSLHASLPEALEAGSYDLVLANILSGPLIELAPELAARTRAGGRVLLSGILETQADEVMHAYQAWFSIAVCARQEGWVLLEGERREGRRP